MECVYYIRTILTLGAYTVVLGWFLTRGMAGIWTHFLARAIFFFKLGQLEPAQPAHPNFLRGEVGTAG